MWRRLTAATLLPLVPLATACTAVRPVRSPAEFIGLKAPYRVWISQADTGLWLERPHVTGDTLVGLVEGDPVTIPLSSVQSMRARQAAPARTLLLAGGLTVAAAVIAVLAVHKESPTSYCDPEEGC